MNQRTVAWFDHNLVGSAIYLNQLFFASLEYSNSALSLENGVKKIINIKNNSDINYELELVQPGIGFDAPATLSLKAQHVTPLELTGNSDEVKQMKNLDIYYHVKNLIAENGENLVVTFSIQNNQ